MKTLIKVTVLAALIISVFSFSKMKHKKTTSNLSNIDIIKTLTNQEYGCRPSSEVMFYVETKLVKKSRGSNTINASIYVLDRASGQSNLLANENIIVPNYKDAILDFDTTTKNGDVLELTNGDKTVGSKIIAPYGFNQLIKYKNLYTSYLKSSNKLLHKNRTI